jgi:hypothetical protein
VRARRFFGEVLLAKVAIYIVQQLEVARLHKTALQSKATKDVEAMVVARCLQSMIPQKIDMTSSTQKLSPMASHVALGRRRQ